MKKIALLLWICCPIFIFGQVGKVKGNKIVELKTQQVEPFTSIEVGDSFEVALVLKSEPTVTVDTDSNLHEYISVKVTDGKLHISTINTITRYKRLFVEIGINSKLTDIFVKGKARLIAKNTLIPERLNIEAFENAEVNLEYKNTNTSLFAKGKSKINAKGESQILSISVNDNSKVEVNAVCKNFSASQNLDSELILSGKAENSIVQIADDCFLNGANFISETAMLSTSGTADSYLSIANKITLEARGDTNTYILGTPLVDLKAFKDGAAIYKTNKAPSVLKSFLK